MFVCVPCDRFVCIFPVNSSAMAAIDDALPEALLGTIPVLLPTHRDTARFGVVCKSFRRALLNAAGKDGIQSLLRRLFHLELLHSGRTTYRMVGCLRRRPNVEVWLDGCLAVENSMVVKGQCSKYDTMVDVARGNPWRTFWLHGTLGLAPGGTCTTTMGSAIQKSKNEVLNKTFELKATEVVLGSHIKLVGAHAGDNGPQNSGPAEFTLTWAQSFTLKLCDMGTSGSGKATT